MSANGATAPLLLWLPPSFPRYISGIKNDPDESGLSSIPDMLLLALPRAVW